MHPGFLKRTTLPVVLALLSVAAARAAPTQGDDLASRFKTAPETAPDQQQLVQIEVNGVDLGNQLIKVSQGKVTLPFATMAVLGIAGRPRESLDLSSATGIVARFDAAKSTLALTVPVSMLSAQRFAPEVDDVQVRLSPETWGAYVNYDFNLRRDFGQSATSSTGNAVNSASRGRSSAIGAVGGLAELRVLAPDVVGSSGWAYDSTRLGADTLVRLDTTLTWRPAWLNMAVSAGDLVSATNVSLAATRPYRFAGLQVGTDYSGTPSWSSSPIPSITGTAQAQSAIDVYLNGQRTFHTNTAGGPFSLVLPPGSTGVGTNVVVTDVTGRSVVIPVDVQRADAQLLGQGVFLWSAGVGAPRFSYGSSDSSYDAHPYGYANARYGVSDSVTATVHSEAGAGLAEVEGGADMAVTPWLAMHGSVAASRSARGVGGSGRLGVVMAGPWGLGLQGTLAHTVGQFDDVVSVSGRRYSRTHGIDPIFSLPAQSEMSARLSWQPASRLSVSASYQANSYKGSTPVGFASLSANYLSGLGIPVFANLSRAMGGQKETALVVGLSFSFGGVQSSLSGGYGTGSGSGSDRGGPTGGFTTSHPLGESVGDIGWNAYGTKSPTGTFANADAQLRTGYGIPGVAVQSFGKQVTGYATLRGSVGVVGLHPFVSDPATGSIIIADAGQSGVPVRLNGYDKGSTSLDGKMALSGAIPGAPQRVAIDTARMPIDMVPSETDRLVVVRDRGAAVVQFGVQSAASSAVLSITYHGHPPPAGSNLVSAASSVPISKAGRAYLPSLDRNEVLTIEMPDGEKCLVRTEFDGRGGVGRKLGPFVCQETH